MSRSYCQSHTNSHAALWLWFPLGPTGIRTLLIFLPALIIYVLRVAQWHVGERQTATRAETSQKYFFRKTTFLTLVFYAFSAWLYGEVYIWSRPSESKLGFTDLGRAHDRLKLNERPFYLRYLFLVLAAAQTTLHLWDDYDSIEVPAMKPRKEREDTTSAVPFSQNCQQYLPPRAWSHSAPLFLAPCSILLGPAIWSGITTTASVDTSLACQRRPSQQEWHHSCRLRLVSLSREHYSFSCGSL
jgi:hypothetical protein